MQQPTLQNDMCKVKYKTFLFIQIQLDSGQGVLWIYQLTQCCGLLIEYENYFTRATQGLILIVMVSWKSSASQLQGIWNKAIYGQNTVKSMFLIQGIWLEDRVRSRHLNAPSHLKKQAAFIPHQCSSVNQTLTQVNFIFL